MTEHTPGPWRIDERLFSLEIVKDLDNGNIRDIAYIRRFKYDTPRDPIREANARLIAASPEMRELLIIVRDRLNRWYTHGNRDPEDIIAIWDEIVTSMSRMEVL